MPRRGVRPYYAGEEVEIKKGMAILAKMGQTHGMRNTGKDRFVFIGIAGRSR